MGGGYLVSELTHPRPFPKGREAPSHERSYVKSVGSESHRSRYQEGSPFPLGRAGDGSSKPKGAASSHLTLNAKSRHDKAYDVHLAKGDLRGALLPWIFVSLVLRPCWKRGACQVMPIIFIWRRATYAVRRYPGFSRITRHSPLAIRRAGHWSLSSTASIGKNNLTNVPSAGVGSSQRSMMAMLCVLPDKALKMLRRSAFILRARLS